MPDDERQADDVDEDVEDPAKVSDQCLGREEQAVGEDLQEQLHAGEHHVGVFCYLKTQKGERIIHDLVTIGGRKQNYQLTQLFTEDVPQRNRSTYLFDFRGCANDFLMKSMKV